MSQEDNTVGGPQPTPNELLKLDAIYRRASNVLLTCRTVFPFDLFPNTLMIDYNKIDIIYRTFFRTSQTISIPISRINHVRVDSTFFLSTLELDVKGYEHNPPPLNFLKTADAHLAKNLVFGLMSASANHIDLSELSMEDTKDKLVGIGRSMSRKSLKRP